MTAYRNVYIDNTGRQLIGVVSMTTQGSDRLAEQALRNLPGWRLGYRLRITRRP